MELKDKTTPNFQVDVRCFTFNQSKYITDTMNGFCMQQTNFPFICCIVDDASTDREQEVIDEYLKENFDFSDGSEAYKKETDYGYITYARHKKNRNCYFYVIYLKENHFSNPAKCMGVREGYLKTWRDSCKYEATCEGDDYWKNSAKIQKQYDFLESHPDYSVCSHVYDNYLENDGVFQKNRYFSKLPYITEGNFKYYKISLDNYWKYWVTQPLSCMVRAVENIQNTIPKDKYDRFYDVYYYYYFLKAGKGALLSDNMGVYRINNTGIWSSKAKEDRYLFKIKQALNVYIVENDERPLVVFSKVLTSLLYYYLSRCQISQAIGAIRNYGKLVPSKYLVKSMSSLPYFCVYNLARKVYKILIK